MRKILLTLLFILFGTTAYADGHCSKPSGSINILANDFPALRTFVETAKDVKEVQILKLLTHLNTIK